MQLKAELVSRVSEKSGKPYLAIEITLNENVKKLVFLTQAETELVKIAYSNTKKI